MPSNKDYILYLTCPNCSGNKTIHKQTLEHPEGEDVDCDVCSGTGEVQGGSLLKK